MFNRPINRWWTVVGGALACAVSIGVISNSFGIFTKAIGADFGWERSEVTFGLTIQHIFSGLSYIPLGVILQRYGVRKPTAILVSICAVGVFCLGFIPSSLAVYYALFVVIGFTSGAATAMPYAVAITRWFDDMRGLALGIMVTGTGVGASLVPLLANWLQKTYGWRGGYMGLSVLMAVGTLFALAFMVRSPPAAPAVCRDEEGAPSLIEILAMRNFWLTGAPVFGLSVAVAGVLINIVPIMTDKGYSTISAVGMLSAAGFSSWGSRILIGALLDRILASYVAAGVMLVAVLGLVTILVAPVWLPAGYFAAICMGFGLGAEADIVAFLVSRYFRPAIYSKIVGAIWLTFAWGYASGISLASWSHDFLGSYAPALGLFIGVALLSAAIVLRLGDYPFPNLERRRRATALRAPSSLQQSAKQASL